MLAAFAIAAQVAFLASVLLLPAVSEYTLIGDHVSELALGQYGFVQQAAFVVVGLGTLALAVAIRALTAGNFGSLVGSLLVGLHGAGAILVAFIPTDRVDGAADVWSQTATGLLHTGISIVSFLSVIVGMLVLTWTFARAARWRSLTFWSGLLASGALSLLYVQGEGQWAGLLQRGFVGIVAAWMILVATRVRSIAAFERMPGAGDA